MHYIYIAVITAGGGNGIGRSICRILARDGARVIAADLDPAAANETIHMLKGIPV